MNSYTFRRTIELTTYLEMANDLNNAANEVIENNLSEEIAVASYGIDAYYLWQKKNNLKYRRLFDKEHVIFTASVKNVVENIWTLDEAVNHYSINLDDLNNEIQKAQQVGLNNYSFDRPINYSNRSNWSYMDEKSLLNDLRNWKILGQVDRITKLCAFEKLSNLAYAYARNNNKSYPRGWNTYGQTDVDWLKRFDMRHHDEIEAIFDDSDIPNFHIPPLQL